MYIIQDDVFGIWSNSTATTTASTWNSWNDGTPTTATGSVFKIWVSNATTTTITTTTNTAGQAWIQWVSVSGQSGQRVIQARQTPQEAAEANRRMEEYREGKKVEAERYRAAKERAEGLLYENLSDEQRAEIKRSKFFVVTGGKTGRRYKINAEGGLSGNVHEIDDSGVLKRRLCAHIDHAANAPIFDHILAQKLMLEYEEEAFLKVANDHGR